MNVIINGGLPTLDQFASELSKGFDECIKVDYKNCDKELEIIRNCTEEINVFTFNNVGTDKPIWKEKNARLFNILVDHPCHYVHCIVRDFYENYYVVCVDIGHVDFLDDILPQCKGHFIFVPHGGAKAKAVDKDIDVLYVGSFPNIDEISFIDVEVENVDSEDFYQYLIEFYDSGNELEPHEIVKLYTNLRDIKINANEYWRLTGRVCHTIDAYHKTMRRKKLVESIINSGQTVHLCGGSWEYLNELGLDNVVYHGHCTPEECVEYIVRAKIVLNDLPSFRYGSHERIFNGMLNGAVVVTNESSYLRSRFVENEDILYWDGWEPENVINNINILLEDEELRKSIADNAYEKVKDSDVWSNRIQDILSRVK